MSVRDWVEFAVELVLLAGAVAAPVWLLIEMRGRRVWVTREEWREAWNPDDWVSRREWEMHERAQGERLAEVILEPLHRIAKRLEELTGAQARSEERDKAFGRSLDELREQIKEHRRS